MPLRVLIVEDSADDAKLLVRALTKQGLEIAAQRVDTREAMQAALQAQPWDLILADHVMPEFNSLDALATLKQSGLDLPFIIVSGLIGEEVAVEAMKAGAHDFITKGKVARLVPAVQRELREAIVRREHKQAEEALRLAYHEMEARVKERTAELEIAHNELRLHQEREISALRELDRQKDEFLSIAAHELKTPITALQGFAQILLRQYEKRGSIEPERLNRGLHAIFRQSKRLTDLILQLLDVSRIEGGQLTLECRCANLVEIVEEAVALARLGSSDHQITIQAPPRVEAIVDPLRIEQVITNLINNALQYGDGPIEISVAAVDGTVEVAVRDHGPGISPEHRPHIFERFYQAKGNPHRGLGLGLYISHEIVNSHGGRIWVECPPDGGARFVARLPDCSAIREEETRVLLVEDNPDDVKLTTKAFQKCGIAHRLDVASDGVEALEYLEGTGKFDGRDPDRLPAVIMLDLKMPRINGIELLQKIRADARTKLVPVVILTNSNEDKDKVESYGLGANSYVQKPVTYARFMEAVRQLGLTWLIINSPP